MYGTAFSLRTILQHQCHDLQNLTTSELQECKWLTKKKVFSAQFNASVVLQEQSEELAVLNDDRNAESALQKKNNVEREVRVESEKNYRTSFMRVVLSGLTKLRWPPSQEAFSDPIDLLFNDDASFLDAVRFLSQVALPATHQHHYRKDFLESPPKTTGINRPTSPGKLASKNEYAFNSSISIIENESNNLPDISELGLSLQNEVANADLGIACEDVSAGELLGLQNHLPREKRMELNWKAFEVCVS